MLYEDFNAALKINGTDFFKSRVGDDIVQSLNPKFDLREYQKEAIGRAMFYFDGFPQKKNPVQLLFNMATGSGKTLIMAANILYLYTQGYRNFIFFVNSTNIIEKTRDNFLKPLSDKYLFAPKIKFGEKEVRIREVLNFEAVSPEDINIIFTTIQGLHIRLNFPQENALTYEDFEEKQVVLISDEAHHINTLTKSKLTKSEEDEKRSWEYTVEKIFTAEPKNILLEFTATIDLGDTNIRSKYDDKIIYQYDLKQFRLDKYSKEIEVLQADLEPIDRALQAVILSQYRRKIAEKNKILLKPVILFKSKDINSSEEFERTFKEKIKCLSRADLQKLQQSKSKSIQRVFQYFEENGITLENLVDELKTDFEENKCLSVNSKNDSEEKQLIVNSLEAKNNEVRAVFAVDKLNEGWDVLNLFDIVRLYDTRDAEGSKPGKTTMAEAQLIGRGARYFPFQLYETQDRYQRKYDEDASNDLRILEQLYYHSAHNPRYIQELHTALVEIGIEPERTVERQLTIKQEFKETDFWKNGFIFLNARVLNGRLAIFGLDDAKISKEHRIALRTGRTEEEEILSDSFKLKSPNGVSSTKTFKAGDFGMNIFRGALDKLEFYKFEILKQYFPHLKSITEFISSGKYLSNVEIIVSGKKNSLENLTPQQKLGIVSDVLKKISQEVKTNTSEFIGTKLFKANVLQQVFKDKILRLDGDSDRAKGMSDTLDLAGKDWYAQNENYGTSEERDFILFLNDVIEKLREIYSEIALLRNERFFQVFSFDDGQRFEPDFVLFLKKKRSKKFVVYQVFVEPKGDIFAKAEPWKQKFLLDVEEKAEIGLTYENKDFRLIGMPFYNESIKHVFKEAFENKILINF